MSESLKLNESIFNLENYDPELQFLKGSLIRLYEVFSIYNKPDTLTCIDYGATNEEQAIFNANKLKSFPCEFINKLEFYDETWQSWGTKEEVKYFLPRVLECITLRLLDQGEAYLNISIRYKLLGRKFWSSSEFEAIGVFAKHMFSYYLVHGDLKAIDEAFDLLIACGLDHMIMLGMIKMAARKEDVVQAMFKCWIYVESKRGLGFDGYYLEVDGEKEKIITNILADNDFCMQLDFIFKEPWNDLLLKGLK
jgi:hypothetical protein